jgi:hypothetical protein
MPTRLHNGVSRSSRRHNAIAPRAARSQRRTVLTGRARSAAMPRCPRPAAWAARAATTSTVSARRGKHHVGSKTCALRHAAHRVRRGRTATTEPSSWRTRCPRPARPPRTVKHAGGQVGLGLLDVQHHDHRDGVPLRRKALSTAMIAKGPARVAPLERTAVHTRQLHAGSATVTSSPNTQRGLPAGTAPRRSCSPSRRARTRSRASQSSSPRTLSGTPHVLTASAARHSSAEEAGSGGCAWDASCTRPGCAGIGTVAGWDVSVDRVEAARLQHYRG